MQDPPYVLFTRALALAGGCATSHTWHFLGDFSDKWVSGMALRVLWGNAEPRR